MVNIPPDFSNTKRSGRRKGLYRGSFDTINKKIYNFVNIHVDL